MSTDPVAKITAGLFAVFAVFCGVMAFATIPQHREKTVTHIEPFFGHR